MDESEWREWVRETGTEGYGPSYTERMCRDGIDIREMVPTATFGRLMRSASMENSWQESGLLRAVNVLNLVDKWPSLYNIIANEMAEEEMTLRTFLDRVSRLPSPHEVGEGQHSTLGDIIGRSFIGGMPGRS
jgi:adenylosuccinate synthase